jgi:hypothetical protein
MVGRGFWALAMLTAKKSEFYNKGWSHCPFCSLTRKTEKGQGKKTKGTKRTERQNKETKGTKRHWDKRYKKCERDKNTGQKRQKYRYKRDKK